MNELTQSILERLATLEKKVEQLEGKGPVEKEPQDVPQHTSDRDSVDLYSIIKVDVTNKRYQPEDDDNYESIIWWDCTYHPDGILKTTRAVKGALEFTDLFGEPQFSILVTIDDAIEPKKTFKKLVSRKFA